jgi:cytochrome oxidase assembly protein ShyY1
VREAEFRQSSGLDALPVMLLQTGGEAGDVLIRDWGTPENPAMRHYGYAAMWLAFALMAAVYSVVTWRKR